MKTRIFAGITGFAALLAAAAAIVPSVFAQATTPAPATPSTSQNSYGNGNGNGYGYGVGNGVQNGTGAGVGAGVRMGAAGASLIDVAADELGMTRTELVAALGGTKSIAQVAGEHNVAVSTIVDAFLAPRAERLDELVAAGTITREQADQMLATMRTQVTEQINEVWTPQGPGPGTGTGTGYVDSNGDGVCDNMPANGAGNRYGSGNGNGNGTGVGTGTGTGNRMRGPGMGPNR